jgi:hypothetical protein
MPLFRLPNIPVFCISPGYDLFSRARNFLPLPSYTTVMATFSPRRQEIDFGLCDETDSGEQIRCSMHNTGLLPRSPVSLAVGALALNQDNTTLPARDASYCFIFHVRPLG